MAAKLLEGVAWTLSRETQQLQIMPPLHKSNGRPPSNTQDMLRPQSNLPPLYQHVCGITETEIKRQLVNFIRNNVSRVIKISVISNASPSRLLPEVDFQVLVPAFYNGGKMGILRVYGWSCIRGLLYPSFGLGTSLKSKSPSRDLLKLPC